MAEAQIGRIALRVEGEMWVAYFAQSETMADAIALGSIRLHVARENEEHRRAFIDLMSAIVGDKIEEAFGMRPIWGAPNTGPEHERAGSV
jgi:hypothetical protein